MMSMNHDRDIAELVEKFLDGRTSNAEEQELYTWFRTHEVPEEWLPLKDMFAWYEEGMPEEKVAAKPAQQRATIIPLRRWLQIAGGCAAVVVVALLIFKNNDIEHGEHSETAHEESKMAVVAPMDSDEDLMRRADLIEQEAYELLAWANTNSL